MLPLPTLLKSPEGRMVADDVWQHILVSHAYKQSVCTLSLSILFTGADGKIPDDDVREQIIVSHPYKAVLMQAAIANPSHNRGWQKCS